MCCLVTIISTASFVVRKLYCTKNIFRSLTNSSYNASIFKIIRQYDYEVTMMEWSSTNYIKVKGSNSSVVLQNSDWQHLYGDRYISRYSNLYLGVDTVAYDTTYNMSRGFYPLHDVLPHNISGSDFGSFPPSSKEGWASFEWITPQVSSTSPILIRIREGVTVDYGRDCSIQVNLYFMAVVVFFNLFKLVVMITVLTIELPDPLVTLGDAAASFLAHPEALTEGKCTLETQELFSSYGESEKAKDSTITRAKDSSPYPLGTWRPRLRRYCSSVGFAQAWSATLS
jgi:hypothetical protein